MSAWLVGVSPVMAAAGIKVDPIRLLPSSKFVGFTELLPAQTGIVFSNQLDDRSVLQNHNLMLGSGVAAGDFDGDGWCDLYFCGIKNGNALYRNQGGWKFEDVTAAAGVALRGRANTGAVFADVDGDGRLDLLLTSLGQGVELMRNEGGGKFRSITAEAGLSSRMGSTTMALGDVDGDGDLDLFVCNYGAQAVARSGSEFQVRTLNGKQTIVGPHAERLRIIDGKLVELGEPPALYLNDGLGRFTLVPWNSTRFLDEQGRPLDTPWDFGLSAQMRDVNDDGAPDIYVCNDFDTPDRFWINDGRGHFRLISKLAQRSQSYSSMGVDFADIDRDGHLDFFVVEMLAAERSRRLWQMNAQLQIKRFPGATDIRPEIARNTLFHARGDGTFEEIANYAGMAASDWSWQGVFLDVDLDGFEDALVVNGHLFDVQDADVPPPRSRRTEDIHAQLLASPRLFTPKRAWRNAHDLRFEDHSAAWQFNDTNLCHGVALADLDKDGDLDVIGNRMNASAWLLCNDSAAPRVAVRLRGAGRNSAGIGAKITLIGGPVSAQTQEIISGGKYLSSDEALRVFAASVSNAMTLEVKWRSGARSTIRDVTANCVYEISETTAVISAPAVSPPRPAPWFVDTSDKLNHVHTEPLFDDLRLQPLLTKKLSQRGPGLCVTDLDGDEHEDLIVGAGRGGRVTFHRGDGRGGFTLAAQSVPLPDDIVAMVEWTPGNGLRGALVSLANYESAATNVPLLFLTLEESELVFHALAAVPALLNVRATSYAIAVADFEGDDDLDVFLGGHAAQGRYPEAARSWLLRNDGMQLRVDETNSATVTNIGLVNSALWTDLDADGWPELAVACEWGPVRLFKNARGRLTAWNPPITSGVAQNLKLDALTGWWTGITAADFDEDGRMDLLVGNWGLNGPQRATMEQPLTLAYGDCLNRGAIDLFEGEYDSGSGELMPDRTLTDVAAGVPPLRQRFATHRAWAATFVKTILAPYPGARLATATTLTTLLLLNRGDRFEVRALPREAQLSPCWSVNTADFDGDGHEDIFLSQNFFALRTDHPGLDAGRGLLLRGNGRGDFAAMPGQESGIVLYGEQRGAVTGDFDGDGRVDLVVSQNGGETKLYHNVGAHAGLRVRLSGPVGNPHGIGAIVHARAGGRSTAARPIHGGSGWMSHNSTITILSTPFLHPTNAEIQVAWPGGRLTRTAVPSGTRAITIDVNASRSTR